VVATVYHLLDEKEPFSERDGGAISRWAANVLRDGQEVIVCTATDPSWGFPKARVICLPGYKLSGYVHAGTYRSSWPLQLPLYTRVFAALLARLQPGDIVYVHNRPAYAAVFATHASRLGFGVVLHMHNSLLLAASRGQLKALQTVPMVFCSRFLQAEAEAGIGPRVGRSFTVYNGADDTVFYPDGGQGAARCATIIYTGRLVAYKGVHILLQAMALLHRERVGVRCRIVGTAGFGRNRRTRYTRSLERMKPPNCEFVGYCSGRTVADVLREADIFCCPSIWNDPFPLAPLEAMATGLPIVASRVGGIPEALASGGGNLVSPNDPETLAAALRHLVENPTVRGEMGAAAYKSFKTRFNWTIIRQQYEDVLVKSAT